MFDANGNPILVVIRQREEGRPYVVHHASKMLNDAKKYYTTIRELLAIVFAFDKFKASLLGISIVVLWTPYFRSLNAFPT